MQIQVHFLENLRLEAKFDDFSVITDQPIRYKGDGTAPSPFDYFLASSALCAAYFVKVYCQSRNIPTDDIKVIQDNIVDPDNRYVQTFNLEIELPESISEQDREGILKAMDRCTVKKVIQNAPVFKISPKNILTSQDSLGIESLIRSEEKTFIPGKDSSLEDTLLKMSSLIERIGIKLEISSWRNPVPHVWSVHLRDADAPMCFSNGKGTTKLSALCSALGEYLERLSTNYFYSDFYLGKEIAQASFVHYPDEKWFLPQADDAIPAELMDEHLLEVYGNKGELKCSHLLDTNSGAKERGVVALPYVRQSDKKTIYIPVNLIANIFASNGMSAGNSLSEARVQALSEIFERAVKNEIITNEITLPDVPLEVLSRYPKILEGIEKLRILGFGVLVKDASLGGRYPVMNVTLMNPKNGGVFASFGSHPSFEVALERSLTELLQGRSFEGLNDLVPPTFNEFAVKEPNNIVDHFIDSTGVISWKFFGKKTDFSFCEWDFSGTTEDEFNYLMDILKKLEKEVYIADYQDLGVSATRILVPRFSEIYQPEELVWDNLNKALDFRDRILNLHDLGDEELIKLISDLEESGIDHYTPISELIGLSLDENSPWGGLNVGELMGLTHLALKNFNEAKPLFEMLSTFSNSLPERKKLHRALFVVLEIITSAEHEMNNFQQSLEILFGKEVLMMVEEIISGKNKFPGLFKTSLNLEGLHKHQKLVESYRKLLRVRGNNFL